MLPFILFWFSFGTEPVFHFFSVYRQREQWDLSEPLVENTKSAQVCFSVFVFFNEPRSSFMGSFLDSAQLCLGLLGSYYFIHVLSGLCSLINHNRSRCSSCISHLAKMRSPHLSQQISDPKNIKVKLMSLLLFGYLPLFLFVCFFVYCFAEKEQLLKW